MLAIDTKLVAQDRKFPSLARDKSYFDFIRVSPPCPGE
jgi:hypothetical protein